MRISTVRLALLMGVAMILGGALVATLPTGRAPASIRQATEDTRDGGVLTPEQTALLRRLHPGTDPATCRYHDTGTASVVTCDDETYMEWQA